MKYRIMQQRENLNTDFFTVEVFCEQLDVYRVDTWKEIYRSAKVTDCEEFIQQIKDGVRNVYGMPIPKVYWDGEMG